MTIVESAAVVGGVSTQAGRHAAAAIDDLGGLLGVGEFPTTPAGCQALLDWLAGFGPVRRVGITSTEGWAAWLARHLRHAGVDVVVAEPGGEGGEETVPLDATGVAQAARSGKGQTLPAGTDTLVEAIGVLLAARGSAERDRNTAVDQIRALVATAPSDVGLRLFSFSVAALIAETAAVEARPGHPVGYATRVALAELGDRAVWLGEQIARLDELLIPLVAAHTAGLLATFAPGGDATVRLLTATDAEVGA